ncbi:hypothetical protein MUK42_36174 [Musa troglodytarum]|uniref:Uncharacterized protein n=1 Tax=Musa troglodytarum TaxID=320322 RepID=A0A9E7JD01_9LILI|nr:hypothetical protein MUK42_36174 [Musa troglodytarum]
MKESDVDEARSLGISPSRSLLANSNLCSFGSFPSPPGMVPLSLLFCTLTRTSELHVEKPTGIGPEKALLKRMSLVRLWPSHRLAGISPESEFDDTSSHCNGEPRPRLVGRGPVSELFQSSSTSNRGKSPMPGGTGPCSLLHMRLRSCRFVSWANSGGIGPETLLSDTSSITNADMLPISFGMSPSKLFLYKNKVVSRCSRPSSGGMAPSRSPTAKSRYSRLDRLPNSAGMLPSSSLYPIMSFSNEESSPSSTGILPDAGIDPWKKLPRKSTTSRDVALERSSGSGPTKLLADAFTIVNAWDEPRPVGNRPTKAFTLTSNSSSDERPDSEPGREEEKALQQSLRLLRWRRRRMSSAIRPLRLRCERSNLSTKPKEPQATPVQLQCVEPAASAGAFQSRRAFSGSTRPDLIASRAEISSSAAPAPLVLAMQEKNAKKKKKEKEKKRNLSGCILVFSSSSSSSLAVSHFLGLPPATNTDEEDEEPEEKLVRSRVLQQLMNRVKRLQPLDTLKETWINGEHTPTSNLCPYRRSKATQPFGSALLSGEPSSESCVSDQPNPNIISTLRQKGHPAKDDEQFSMEDGMGISPCYVVLP